MNILENNGIKLPYLLTDGMVLQRESEICIWGEASPRKELKLTLCDTEYSTTTGEDGKWKIVLDHLKAGGPYDMILECDNDKRTIQDILIGDVWVLGGQSNMQLPIARTLDLFAEEVEKAECYEIRKFLVPEAYDFHGPKEELEGGSWESVTPVTVYNFSAVGYFFAKKIYEKYKVPIGLIQTAIGGTPAQAWMSEKSVLNFARFKETLALCKHDSYVNGIKQKEESDNNSWYQELFEKDQGRKDREPWYSIDCNDSDWKEMELPESFHKTELEEVKGAVWFRKEIFIPEGKLKGKAKLKLGTIVDADDTYINGVKIGSTGYLYPPRRYDIPEGLLKPGRNVLAVRVIITQNIGGFRKDMPYLIKANGHEMKLTGTWKYKVGAIMRAQNPTTFFQYKPTGVYNRMIYPLRNFGVRGILWYQGESNTGEPGDYKELLESVIRDWRTNWNKQDLPFLYVQLPNHCYDRMEPKESGWAKVRDAQRKVMKVPSTGMAITLDAGEYNELHPQDKKTIGNRLALWAQKLVYGEDLVCCGPVYDHMEKCGEYIRLYFNHTGSGLTCSEGELKTFEVCSEEGIFHPAEAVIEDHTVVVYSKAVKQPVHVRYAWSDNPEDANLYNKEGLPASTFITKE